MARSKVDFDRPYGFRTTGKDIAFVDILFRDTAIVNHVYLSGGFADLAGAADAKGAAGRDDDPGTTSDGQNRICLIPYSPSKSLILLS